MSWLYETPWWLPTGLVLVGVILFVSSNRSGSKGRLAGIGVIALGIVLGLASYFLESDREIVERRTKELVAAVVSADQSRIAGYLDPQVNFMPLGKGRDPVSSAAKSMADSYGLESAGVTGDQTEVVDSETIIIAMDVAARAKNGSAVTKWKLRWNKEGKQWMLTKIEFMGTPTGGISGDDILRAAGRFLH